MSTEDRRLYRHTLVMAVMTAASRILGYVRDRVLASLLGTSYLADAFYIAFRIPNTFRRFVAEGAMTASLVPVLSQSFKTDPRDRAWLFARRFFWMFGAFLVLFGILGSLAAPVFVKLLAWEYATKAPHIYNLTIHLTAIIFPYITLISLASISQGILNTQDIFGPPSFAPALFNATLITAAVAWGFRSSHPTEVMAWAVLAGGVAQLAFLIPYLKGVGMTFAPAWSFKDPHVKAVFSLMLPGVLGAGVNQVIILVGTAMATFVGEGAVAALYYANRITELSFALFAVSLSTAILPQMSRQVVTRAMDDLQETLRMSLSLIFFGMLPAAVGLMVLAHPIVRVLLETGRFKAHSVAMTYGPLAAYAAGITVWSLALVLVRVCHAHRDMIAPFLAGLATLATYVVLGILWLKPYGTTGIAAASSVSAVVNLGTLIFILKRKHGIPFPWAWCFKGLARIGALCAVMGVSAWWVFELIPHGRLLHAVLALFSAIAVGGLVYFTGAFLFRVQEAHIALEFVKKRLLRRK